MLRRMREVVPHLSPELNVVFGAVNAPPAPFVPPEHHMRPGYIALLVSFAGPELHAQAAAELTADLPALVEMATPMPYVALQQLLDEANQWGLYAWEKGTNLAELPDAAIDALAEQVANKASPLSIVLFYRLDGAYCATSDEDSAFGGRRVPQYATFILGAAPDAAGLAKERDWVRATWSALQPFAFAGGAYVNGQSEFDDARVRAAYGDKYARLAELKTRYDPHDVFHRTANIRPAVA